MSGHDQPAASVYEPSTEAMRPIIQLADRLHRWRWITPGRRAELILLLREEREQRVKEGLAHGQ